MRTRIAVWTAIAALAALGWGCSLPEGASKASEAAAAPAEPTKAMEKTLSPNPSGNGKAGAKPVVVIETSMGTIKAELWADKAPQTVENFLKYADERFYDGTIFHRVISGFMIRGGGFTPAMQQKRAGPPVKNEARADAPNARGTLAMARTSDPHSASAQFFVNLVDNGFLNFRSATAQGYGYCVFGKVIEGMDVVDKIAKVATATRGPSENVPVQPVEIKSIQRAK